MAKNKARIQQRRAKRKHSKEAARKARRQRRDRAMNRAFAAEGTSRSQIRQAPLAGAWAYDDIFDRGIGHVVVARCLPDGRWAAGVFLVDVRCLGVKNAFLAVRSEHEVRDNLLVLIAEQKPLTEVEPAYAGKLIKQAVAYARELGFEPHGDYRDAGLVLDGIDTETCEETFTFGKDGKPFFVNGPHISLNKSRQIINRLTQQLGPDGFDYMVGLHETDEDMLDDEYDMIEDEKEDE